MPRDHAERQVEGLTGAGPCPDCGAEWAYEWTTEEWDGALPCTRVDMYRRAGKWFLRCPDCAAIFGACGPGARPPAMTKEELLAARERRLPTAT